jgi:MFS family permease
MIMKDPINARLIKRLAPLYVAAFFHAFVLWYAIEKLFMRSIGFDDAGISLMVAAYSALMLLAETPSGIMADRWSRKGTLMVASVLLSIASLICGLASEPVLYIIGALAWGTFFSMYSGTYDSIIYDTVKEETGSGDLYEKYFGRFRFIDSLGLISGALVGGAIGAWLGLEWTFLLSVPLGVGSLVALWLFKEPKLHKEGQHNSVVAHVRETFRLVLGQPVLLPLVGLIVTVILALVMVYEFNQLWLIALNTPPAWFGVAVSITMAASGVAGYVVSKAKKRKKQVKFWLHVGLLLSALALTVVPHIAFASAALFTFAFTGVCLNILAMRDLHDVLPSRVRAGASSSLSSLARIFVIPVSLLFGTISATYSVFNAAWIVVVLAVIIFTLEYLRPKTA